MGAQGVNGQELSVLLPERAATAPAPPTSSAKPPAAPEPAVAEGAEEQVQRPAPASGDEALVRPRSTRLRVDEETERIVAQVLDENNEVIRQIPPEEVLRIAAQFRRFQDLLFDEQI